MTERSWPSAPPRRMLAGAAVLLVGTSASSSSSSSFYVSAQETSILGSAPIGTVASTSTEKIGTGKTASVDPDIAKSAEDPKRLLSSAAGDAPSGGQNHLRRTDADAAGAPGGGGTTNSATGDTQKLTAAAAEDVSMGNLGDQIEEAEMRGAAVRKMSEKDFQAAIEQEDKQLAEGHKTYVEKECKGDAKCAANRQLQTTLSTSGSWDWPAGTSVTIGDGGTASTGDIYLRASTASSRVILYDSVMISISTDKTFGTQAHASPKLKLVKGTATDRSQCNDPNYDVPLDLYWNGTEFLSSYMSKTNPFSLAKKENTDYQAFGDNQPIAFQKGGQYKICYAPDGAFGGSDVNSITDIFFPNTVKIYGISSPCTTENCMQAEVWNCWYAGLAESDLKCKFSFRTVGGRLFWKIEAGIYSMMTWSHAWPSDVLDGNGHVTSASSGAACGGSGATTPDTTKFDNVQTTYIDVTRAMDGSLPLIKHNVQGAFTVRACYCPNYASNGMECDNPQEYIQSFGVVYFWRVSLCDNENGDVCVQPYLRVTPHQKVTIRLECPAGGACQANDNNRISFIGQSPENNRQNWDPNQGCKLTSAESSDAHWPLPSDARALSGGTRQDYKIWRTKQPRFSLSVGSTADVCYCNADCTTGPANWFRVGSVTIGKMSLAAASNNDTSAVTNKPLIQIVGKPGTINFFAGVTTPHYIAAVDNKIVKWNDGNQFSGKAILNIISFDREKIMGTAPKKTLEEHYNFGELYAEPATVQSHLDAKCRDMVYSDTLVDGPSSLDAAKVHIAQTNAPATYNELTNSNYMSFTGTSGTGTFSVKLSGVVAICYCGLLDATNNCINSNAWVFSQFLMVAGPAGGQKWELPTEAISKLDIEGAGFVSGDILRIIASTAECTDNTFNPPNDPSFKMDCPSTSGTGCKSATATDVLTLSTTSQATAGVGLQSVDTSLSTTTYTVLVFTGDIHAHINEGDTLVISKDDMRYSSKAPNEWTEKQKDDIDYFTNNWRFPDRMNEAASDFTSNNLGWKVKYYKDPSTGLPVTNKVTIPMHWNKPGSSNNPASNPGVISFHLNDGDWYRSNRISTNAEIKAKTGATDLKVRLYLCLL